MTGLTKRRESPLAGQLRLVLSRYLSALTVSSVLDKVYADERLDPEHLRRHHLEQIYQNSLFMSVRLFCKPDQLSDAMMDLAELMEPLSANGRLNGAR